MSQKISQDHKPKVQLQLILHSKDPKDQVTHTFHFANPGGKDVQLRERNEVKELLLQLLPRFSKKKLTKDIETKQKILTDHPDLFQLYKDLVSTEVITADEFWSQVAPSRLQGFDIKSFAKSVTDLVSGQSEIGISPDFLTQARVESVEGCNRITYNISPDFIQAVFKTYPGVKRKHFENVPVKMTDEEFWSKFFQSHYYHRDRVFTSNTKGDLFADCAREDDQSIKAVSKDDVDSNFFLDLTCLEDVRPEDVLTVLEISEGTDAKSKRKNGGETVNLNPNQALIKRFNHYSIMILDASTRNGRRNERKEIVPEKLSHDDLETCTEESDTNRKRKHDLIEEKTHYDDLEGDTATNSDIDWLTVESRPLNITDKSRYMEGPKASSSDEIDPKKLRMDIELLDSKISTWIPGGEWIEISVKSKVNDKEVEEIKKEHSILRSTAAGFALNDLRPGGPRFESSLTTLTLPTDDQEQLKDINKSLNELLKHFWSCFPIVNDSLHSKASSLYSSLKTFQRKVLDPFKEKLTRDRLDNEVG